MGHKIYSDTTAMINHVVPKILDLSIIPSVTLGGVFESGKVRYVQRRLACGPEVQKEPERGISSLAPPVPTHRRAPYRLRSLYSDAIAQNI